MVARQNHGFVYESLVIDKFSLIKCDKYTDKYDAYTSSNIPVQIKCIKKGRNIDLGDIFRNVERNNEFYFIVGFYDTLINGTPNIVDEYILYIPCGEWSKLLYYDNYSEFKTLIQNISNDKSDDSIWKSSIKKLKLEWNSIPRYIQPAFKRDHKKQKRIQCYIQNKIFYSYFVKNYNVENKKITI